MVRAVVAVGVLRLRRDLVTAALRMTELSGAQDDRAWERLRTTELWALRMTG